MYLNKFIDSCYVQNHAAAQYELQSDGTNITASSIGDLNCAFYNYGTFRESGGDGISRLTAACCNYCGTVEVLSSTLQFASYFHSNGVVRLNGGNVYLPTFTLNGGTLQGTGTVSIAGTLTSSDTGCAGLVRRTTRAGRQLHTARQRDTRHRTGQTQPWLV